MNDILGINIKQLLKIALIAVGILLGIFIAVRLALYLAPFIIAFALASLMEPGIRLLMRKARMRRKIAATITVVIFLSILGLLLTLLVAKLVTELISLTNLLPDYYSKAYNNISGLVDRAMEIYLDLPEEMAKSIEDMLGNISKSLMDLLYNFLKKLLNTAISLPQVLIFILVTILATYFMASDRDKLYNFFNSQLPKSWISKFTSIRDDLFSALFGYIRAQGILMTVTFTELFIGFTVIGIKHSLTLSLIISIIDALPILGTGGVLVPWAVYSFLTGNIKYGFALLILYVVVLVVRQLIEPKVLGKQIGLHPLAILLSMYGGLQIFGFLGMIIGPVTVLVLKNMISGLLKGRPIRTFFAHLKE